MSITVRDVAVTEGVTSGYGEEVAVTLPAYESGDTLLVFYVGESFESAWSEGWQRSDDAGSTSGSQSGTAFYRQATGTDSDALAIAISGPSGYTIIAVATIGRTYLDPTGRLAQTGTLPEESFTADAAPNPANRVLHFLSARTPTSGEMPTAPGTLLGSGRGGPADKAVAGLWLATPAEAAGPLHLPERSASFWLTVRVYQAVVTYSDPQTATVSRLEDGAGGAQWDTYNAARVVVDNVTDTYREAPDATTLIAMQQDARDADANYTILGSSGWVTNAFHVETDYTSGSSGLTVTPPYHTINTVIHGFHPTPIAREEVADTEAGHVYWNPAFLDPSEVPSGALGWEWDDGNVDERRDTTLDAVTLSCGVAVDPVDTTAHPHTHPVIVGALFAQSSLVDWDTSSGHATVVGWTPAMEYGLAEYEPITSAENPAEIVVDLLDYLDPDGRAVLFSKAATHADGSTVIPIAPEVPGYIATGSSDGDMDYGPVASLFGSGYFTVEWRFTTPTFRWVTSFEEIVEEVEPGALRLRKYPTASLRKWPPEQFRGTSLRKIGSYP